MEAMSEISSCPTSDRICQECGKKLNDQPAVLVDGTCFCFLHAKRAYPIAVAQRQKEERGFNPDFARQMAEFEKRKKAHEQTLRDRQDKRFRYSLDNGFSGSAKWLL